MKTTIRRYDLDWLRVIVFGLLIFYHVGMFFVPWGWHIKNNEIYDWLRWPMLFLNQWRLPILFVISGMGTCYALGKRSKGKFVWERFLRLGIPLVVGMILIVPPQVYFERLVEGTFSGSYWEYFTTVAFDGVYPEGNLSWHHLWFLPYLLVFSWVLTPLFVYLRKHKTRFIEWVKHLIQKPWGIYLFVIPLYLVESLVEPFFPITHALVDDWFNFIFSIILFFYGFVLIATGDVFWQILAKVKKKALTLGVIGFSSQVIIWLFFEDGYVIHFTEALLKVVNIWSWILVLFAYAAKYLNKPSKGIAYANRAVYPFYILHQTITVGIAYYLRNLDWGLVPKTCVLVVGTFGISWLIYDLVILRVPLLHPLFGLKGRSKRKPAD
ncbi:acyltransferase family protein [Flagellimonas halotolerans]|uniref:Acyltransferase family protein n=1 Tax=Flagellimonas halotolerans TaxID=3112164 RepID=A0ABU6INW1_9FLAO|nr:MULTISPECIES: acyltransferase family protein [unclassified Allomuricauda]MEC3964878.1 acyltransferase family protein [Muricauda sp. SYSU M86414]MEC4264758.1 acyltransferase family protein [Muricauda sp. SYSU M84420]